MLCVLCIFIIKLRMFIYFTPVTNFPVFYGPKLQDYLIFISYARNSVKICFPMPTDRHSPKNGFQILNLHPKKYS